MSGAVGVGLYLAPGGQFMVAPGLGVALGVAMFIGSVIAGLVTARLVMP